MIRHRQTGLSDQITVKNRILMMKQAASAKKKGGEEAAVKATKTGDEWSKRAAEKQADKESKVFRSHSSTADPGVALYPLNSKRQNVQHKDRVTSYRFLKKNMREVTEAMMAKRQFLRELADQQILPSSRQLITMDVLRPEPVQRIPRLPIAESVTEHHAYSQQSLPLKKQK